MSGLEIHPVAGALGAEIHGVDLGQDLDDASIARIRRALLDHCVIFFRGQQFDAAQHKALARRFGEISTPSRRRPTGATPCSPASTSPTRRSPTG
jgi:taurine dioxygenase